MAAFTDDQPAVKFTYATPFDLSGIQFQSVLCHSSSRSWEVHAGCLRADNYRELHLGGGRTVSLGEGLSLFAALRYFSVNLAEVHSESHWSASMLLQASPAWLSAMSLSAGIVDQPLQSTSDNTALFVMRSTLGVKSHNLVLEHLLDDSGRSETTLVIASDFDALSFINGYRCLTGEISMSLAIRAGKSEVTLTRRWHPELGWTSSVGGTRRF